jgi:hypothetical protein
LCNKTAWHIAAESGHVEVLVKLWDWAKELQLNPEELRNQMSLSKTRVRKRPGTLQQKEAMLKY